MTAVLDGASTAASPPAALSGALVLKVCWGVALVSLALSLWSTLSPTGPGMLQAFALPLVVVYVAIHATLSYGWRGAAAFLLISGVVALLTEISSVHNGFPFGYYVHNRPGIKLAGVPYLIPFAYATMGWSTWVLARIIVRDRAEDGGRVVNQFFTPIVAAFILTFLDFASDPIGGTITQSWTYRHPGGYFGVPLTNYLGWFFTGWVFFQLFALIEKRFVSPYKSVLGTTGYWAIPCLIVAMNLLRFPVKFLQGQEGTVSIGERTFVIADIYESGIAASLLTIGFAVTLAAMRLWSRNFKNA